VKREFHAVSDLELRQRLAESFDLLVKEKSQQQNPPAFSKEPILLNPQAPNPSTEKKGA
jgi:hypothetical protein